MFPLWAHREKDTGYTSTTTRTSSRANWRSPRSGFTQRSTAFTPLFPIRRLGTISSNFVSLARVTIPDRDSYKVEWNLGLAKDKNVDMEAVVRAMAADEKERPAIEWG